MLKADAVGEQYHIKSAPTFMVLNMERILRGIYEGAPEDFEEVLLKEIDDFLTGVG